MRDQEHLSSSSCQSKISSPKLCIFLVQTQFFINQISPLFLFLELRVRKKCVQFLKIFVIFFHKPYIHFSSIFILSPTFTFVKIKISNEKPIDHESQTKSFTLQRIILYLLLKFWYSFFFCSFLCNSQKFSKRKINHIL